MDQRASRVPHRYDASLDRAGLALGAGSILGGSIALAMVLGGGQRDPLTLLIAFLLGSGVMGVATTAVGGPLWLVFHVAGMRRAVHAASVGAFSALAIFVGAQTYGFGLFDTPVADGNALLYRWLSALATGLLLALVCGCIAVIMWRIAYRRRY